MPYIQKLCRWFWLVDQKPEILLAQYRALQRQVPLLYAMLMVNAAAVSYTHYDSTPRSLTVSLLLPLIVICTIRLIVWVRRRGVETTAEEAIRQLRKTIVLAGILAAAHIAWSLALDSYGGPIERGHVALFIAITVIGCIFCLMNLPQAALLVMVVVTVPYLTYYASLSEEVFLAIALNIFLVNLVIVQVLLNGYSGFTQVVRSRIELADKQRETERLSIENSRLAHTDPLTGLPNRRHFFAMVEDQIEKVKGSGQQFHVGVLDLDRFKPINDTYGHNFGDQLLMEVGKRLGSLVSDDLQICRVGGDEFGILLTLPVTGVEKQGQQICDLLSAPYEIGETRVSIGCSCGLAVYPDAGRSAHELFDRSDYALYNSKSQRRGQATLYSADHETQIKSGRAIESALHAADIDQELDVYFQPIVRLDTLQVIGFEALARWQSPTLGPVAPDQFIPMAERTGLIHRITVKLFTKAILQLKQLPDDLGLSFNLSANDLTSFETVVALLNVIRDMRVQPARITFELTETSVLRSFEAAENAMRMLRAAGVKLALDDFGTGYSSLSYLHRLPIDKVKIDRSFVAGMDGATGRGVIASILALCLSMDLECVVEGIEDEQQLALLRKFSCEQGQGYLFARPMPRHELRQWVAENSLVCSQSA